LDYIVSLAFVCYNGPDLDTQPRRVSWLLTRRKVNTTMAEAIGTIASVAQLVHLSGTILAGGYGFLSTVARAPSEIRSLL